MELNKKQIALLDRYAKRRLSRAQAAQRIGVSERQVNRLLKTVELERVVSESHTLKEKAKLRRGAREQAAKAAKSGKISIEQAAARAGCSERTIYRYFNKV